MVLAQYSTCRRPTAAGLKVLLLTKLTSGGRWSNTDARKPQVLLAPDQSQLSKNTRGMVCTKRYSGMATTSTTTMSSVSASLPNKARSSTTTIPFFVLKLPDGRAKALFTVPTDMAEALVLHPILCRGASFDLEIDVVSQGRRRNPGNDNDDNIVATSFLSAQFRSPHPEETAREISERIVIRMGSTGAGRADAAVPSLAGMLGMR